VWIVELAPEGGERLGTRRRLNMPVSNLHLFPTSVRTVLVMHSCLILARVHLDQTYSTDCPSMCRCFRQWFCCRKTKQGEFHALINAHISDGFSPSFCEILPIVAYDSRRRPEKYSARSGFWIHWVVIR